MKLRDLFVRIGFDVDDKALTHLDKGLQKTKTLILAVGGAATASAGLLYGMAKSVADAGDKAAKTADKLGVQIEALQELRYAAELSGIAQQNFDTALQRMTRRAAEAARGTGEAKDALRALNVSLTDGQGRMRRSEDLLAEIADGMARIEDPSRRVALAFKLFDTEGVGMVNMLSKGGDHLRRMRQEARGLGFVLSEQTARDAELFQDELLRSKSVLAGIKNSVGADLLPVFIELMVQFRQWVALNRQIIKGGIDKLLRAAITLLRWLYHTGREVVRVLADLVELFGGIEAVAKAAAWAIGLFAGAQVLMAIGNMAMGLMGIVKALRAVRLAALLANAATMAIPLLIGAAVAAAILIIQDIISFFQGKDSVTGIIVEAFKTHVPRAIDFAVNWMKEMIGKGIDWVIGRFNALLDAVKTVFAMIKKIMTFTIGDALDWLGKKIAPLLEPLGMVKSWLDKSGDSLSGAWNTLKNLFTVGPATAPVQGAGPISNRQDVNVNAPITVSVPEGTPPDQVGRAVRQGISDGIGRMLRDASFETAPNVGW